MLHCWIDSGYRKSLDKKGEYLDFPSKKFLSHSAENFCGEYIIVALTSRTEKVWRRGGGQYEDFPSKIFCLTVSKSSVGSPLLLPYFRVPKKFGYKGGGVSR